MIDPQSVPHVSGIPVVENKTVHSSLARDEGSLDLTRYEECLRVRTVSVPKERVRFRKVVITEEKTVTFTVRREELRILREPLSENEHDGLPNGSPETPDLDVVLHEEQIFFAATVVPVERVRVGVLTLVDDLPVTDDIRKERLEVTTTAVRARGSVDGVQAS